MNTDIDWFVHLFTNNYYLVYRIDIEVKGVEVVAENPYHLLENRHECSINHVL
jgi:hypothetical protein